jgi:hypothetical protein
MYLSDNVNKPKKYQITKGDTPAQTIIPAHGYLIVWCDKLDPQSQLHSTFKLDADGGDVLLTAKDESWSDRLTYTLMSSDQTAGRYPDGTGDVFVMNVPTIGQPNITSSYVVDITANQPTGIIEMSEELRVKSEDSATAQWYTLDGRRVTQPTKGLYIVNGKKVVIK